MILNSKGPCQSGPFYYSIADWITMPSRTMLIISDAIFQPTHRKDFFVLALFDSTNG
jgi:hypothetical protein